MKFVVHHGDCLVVMRTMPDSSVDSIVTDPPYGLSFMGKRWDYDVPAVEVWAECLRVLKPGGHMLAFAGTRTQHRMAVRIEDAGFEIRDMIAWVYGSGFPKSHNGEWGGTALKPALEPITMARKPLAGTVEANWCEHGTGALNIDGCRITTEEDLNGGAYAKNGGRSESQSLHGGSGMNVAGKTAGTDFVQPAGRWPANLIHDGSEEVLDKFPGGEGRFFYGSKANKSDKNEGLDDHVASSKGAKGNGVSRVCERCGISQLKKNECATPKDCPKSWIQKSEKNHHPTVKPTDLMRYLCRLVTPPGGTVLDPFTGSGSTGKAAVLEGFRFVGIEREAEYVEIARARIDFAVKGNDIPQGDLFEVNP